MYNPTPDQIKRRENNFCYHAPKTTQVERYTSIRDQARGFAEMLENQCPPSRELAVAMTKLEEVVMWANASIARNE